LSLKKLYGLRKLISIDIKKNKIDIPTAEARKKMPVKKQKKPNFSAFQLLKNFFFK
tara:strand:+ start:17 stop:184 length:168 start_codon:yes stop_codon:yes gene_type:complete